LTGGLASQSYAPTNTGFRGSDFSSASAASYQASTGASNYQQLSGNAAASATPAAAPSGPTGYQGIDAHSNI
jgi:hypothetical protein